MLRSLALGALCAILPGCVAAIGNTGYGSTVYSKAATPLLEQRVAAAQRIVDLRQANLEVLRTLQESGKVGSSDLWQAEIAVEEARLVLLGCKADLDVASRKKKDDD